jgi:hypothetical protein
MTSRVAEGKTVMTGLKQAARPIRQTRRRVRKPASGMLSAASRARQKSGKFMVCETGQV